MSVKVFGHLNPDTDAITSALIYAWYLREKRGMDAVAYRLGDLNKETAYVLERFGFRTPDLLTELIPGEEVVLVDTNNADELLAGMNETRVLEIIDHHKLTGNLVTAEPPSVTMRPVACTATVIWELMQRDGCTTLPAEVAGLMASALVSDTLNLTSPTTTDTDRTVLDELIALAGIDRDELAGAMFAAKSDLSGYSAEQLLLLDSKVYTYGDQKVRLSVLETTKPENALALLPELLAAIDQMKAKDGLAAVFFFVVDILKSEAHLVVNGSLEEEKALAAFGATVAGNMVILPGVVSRKKQMVPPLEKVFSNQG